MRYLKRYKAMWIAGVLLLVAGLCFSMQWPQPIGIIYFINIAPGLLLLFFWLLASVAVEKQWVRTGWPFVALGIVATLLSLAFATLVNFSVGVWIATTTPYRDPALYEEALKYYRPEMVAHFPPHIPAAATDVRFYFRPAFLQGGSFLQLHCRLPQPEVQTILETYLPLALHVLDGQAGVPPDFQMPYFELDSGPTQSLPEGFQVLVLDTYIADHGYTYGVAVNLQRQEVIYWAEHW